MLNNFCFHVYAQRSLFKVENVNAFFYIIISSSSTLSCYFRVHRAGSQLKKIMHWKKTVLITLPIMSYLIISITGPQVQLQKRRYLPLLLYPLCVALSAHDHVAHCRVVFALEEPCQNIPLSPPHSTTTSASLAMSNTTHPSHHDHFKIVSLPLMFWRVFHSINLKNLLHAQNQSENFTAWNLPWAWSTTVPQPILLSTHRP